MIDLMSPREQIQHRLRHVPHNNVYRQRLSAIYFRLLMSARRHTVAETGYSMLNELTGDPDAPVRASPTAFL